MSQRDISNKCIFKLISDECFPLAPHRLPQLPHRADQVPRNNGPGGQAVRLRHLSRTNKLGCWPLAPFSA
jgi:hypothetical protein